MARFIMAANTGGFPMVQGTPAPFKNDVEVLNYALTLEHLEATFYREALKKFDNAAFTAAGYQTSVRDYLVEIGKHEQEHVDALTAVIKQLKGEPVKEATYDFGYTDLASFLKLELQDRKSVPQAGCHYRRCRCCRLHRCRSIFDRQ
ncbi:MAG: hypothetical protein C4345_07775 [Chloroflexota bacterium]